MADKTQSEELRQQLRTRIEKHDDFLCELVSVVPAKYYMPDTEAFVNTSWKKYGQNKKEKNPKQLVKDKTKKAKKLKLDPEVSQPTVLELQEEQHRQGPAEEDEEASVLKPVTLEASKTAVKPVELAGSISELKERIKTRIANLRRKRNITDEDGPAQKRPRTEEKKKKKKEATVKGSADQELRVHLTAADMKQDGTAQDGEEALVYSKFDFGVLEKKNKASKKATLKQLLTKAETEKEKLDLLKEKDGQKAVDLEEKKAQRKALAMAQGVKQTDDVSLLKKAIKRKDKAKLKSAKSWNERKTAVDESVAKRIATREANIKARVQAKADKRMGVKAPKKKGGRKDDKGGKKGGNKGGKKGRPGFEGKR